MSNVQSAWTRHGRCWTNSTREEHSVCRDGSTISNLVLNFTPLPQEALQGDQSDQSVTLNHPSLTVIVILYSKNLSHITCKRVEPRTLQIGSICSSVPVEQGGSIHLSFSTSDTSGHRLRPRRSRNLLVRIFTPIPHVFEHSDHSLHSVVSQSGSLLLRDETTSSSLSSSPLKNNSNITLLWSHIFTGGWNLFGKCTIDICKMVARLNFYEEYYQCFLNLYKDKVIIQIFAWIANVLTSTLR